ncbi:hypothetical protein RRF57_009134 [Xylaria bambusicola]|uniref:Uncharacterized protein n=1 Tax=Xylaria bambusicola TaxID=326684 RepID=A0AAN7UJ29_9PEZI
MVCLISGRLLSSLVPCDSLIPPLVRVEHEMLGERDDHVDDESPSGYKGKQHRIKTRVRKEWTRSVHAVVPYPRLDETPSITSPKSI